MDTNNHLRGIPGGNLSTQEIEGLRNEVRRILHRTTPPKDEEYIPLLIEVNTVLDSEEPGIRPKDSSGLPGGVINLKPEIPTVIVPDLHARVNFLASLLFLKKADGLSVLEMLMHDWIQIVCVGDGFHSERPQLKRWKKAFAEYQDVYKRHRHMDGEMQDSLGVMQIVKLLKTAFPANFHFLKGNHENIGNEEGGGNHPFRKFVYEGPMVVEYVKKFYSEEFFKLYYAFEKKLPLLARGKNFIISHAEPSAFYDTQQVIEYRNNPEVVEGLTWTPNDGSETGTVQKMIEHYLDEAFWGNGYYFGGHRPVSELYNLRAGGKYVQIHNPQKFIVVLVQSGTDFDLDRDIIEIQDMVADNNPSTIEQSI